MRQKSNYDRSTKESKLMPGQFVWRWYLPLQNRDKLNPRYLGPYKVLEDMNWGTYRIQRNKSTRPIVVHRDHLKPHFGPVDPADWEEMEETEPGASESSEDDEEREEGKKSTDSYVAASGPLIDEEEEEEEGKESADSEAQIKGRGGRDRRPPPYLSDYVTN